MDFSSYLSTPMLCLWSMNKEHTCYLSETLYRYALHILNLEHIKKEKDQLSFQCFSFFTQAANAEHKECHQLEQPPGGSKGICRFDEFCACDFYELSIEKDVSDRDLKKDIRQRRRINDTFDDVLSQGQEYKTHCQLGERGICLHVCELTILRPGSCK